MTTIDIHYYKEFRIMASQEKEKGDLEILALHFEALLQMN